MGPTTAHYPSNRFTSPGAMVCMLLLWLFCTVSAFASDDDDDENEANKQPLLNFPYATDFEKAPPGTPPPQAVWSATGYWQIYRANAQQPANTGVTFLNSNPNSLFIPAKAGKEKDKDDEIEKTHIAALKRYITIPKTSKNPMLRFWHRPNIPIGGSVDVQIRMRGVNLKEKDREWNTLISYSNANNANAYLQQLIPLDGYLGATIRIRFVTHINRGQAALKWWIDDVLIGESGDQDGDGIPDDKDLDRDGDGISNEWEIIAGTHPDDKRSVPPDMDHDGIPDAFDPDRDGDGVLNNVDAFPDDPTEWSDLDHDGIGDNKDTDRDGDGISNEYEVLVGTNPNDPKSVPVDANHNGIPDILETKDRDHDGVPDDKDAFPDDPTEWSDLDGDGIGDNKDTDRDGDGIDNNYEIQLGFNPNDANSVPPDLDKDGIPDALDDDRDGDGVPNASDAFPDNPREWKDTDGDGVGDNADPDRDGDGISNIYEVQLGFNPDDPRSTPPDLDKDGIPDALDGDRDGDGVANEADAFPDDPTEWADLDHDGIGDNKDSDRDGDGISNDDEIKLGFNPDDPKNTPPDQDHDGIPDALDPDRDGDGVANEQDLYPDDASRSAMTPVSSVSASLQVPLVNVKWSPVADLSKLTGYLVYRNGPNQVPQKITAAPITTTEYIDAAVNNNAGYEYRVSAVDILNHETSLSTPGQIFVAYNTITVSTLSAQRSGNNVALAWISGANAQYRIYRGLDSAAPSVYAASASNSYSDNAAPWDHGFTYQVVSLLSFSNPFTQQTFELEGPLSNSANVVALLPFTAQWSGVTTAPDAVAELLSIGNTNINVAGNYQDAAGPVSVQASSGAQSITGAASNNQFNLSLPPIAGSWSVTLSETNSPNRSVTLALRVLRDSTAPNVGIDGATSRSVSTATILLTGAVTDDYGKQFTGVAINQNTGANIPLTWPQSNTFNVEVPLNYGANNIDITVNDPSNNPATTSVAVNRLSPVLNVTALAEGSAVNVQWEWPADTSIIQGYNVYRNIAGTTPTKLTPSPIVSAQYIDTDVANGTGYEYRVTSVDNNNQESDASAPAPVFIAYNDQVMTVTAQRKGATVNVAWNNVANARYNLYRATWSPPSTLLTTLTTNNYVDDNNEWMYYSYYAVTSILTFTNPFTQQSVEVESAQSAFVYVPELPPFSALWTTAGATSDPAAVIILNKTAINNKTVSATGRYLNATGPVQITAVGNTETLTAKSTDGTFRFSFPAENSFWIVTLQEIDPPQRSFLLVMGMINDTTPPTININGSNTRVESSNSVIITGNVNDDWASTFTGSARNNRSGTTSFGVVWSAAGDFSVEVPVSIGDNTITIEIADPSGNVATAQVNVNRPAEQVPTLTITSPGNGTVVTTNKINVTGIALSSLPPEQIKLTLNGAVAFPQATSTPQNYSFTFPDVALSAGVNVLTVNATTSAGNSAASVSIMNQQDTAPKKVAPPVISITSPIPGSSVTDNNIVIRGTVTMAAGFGRLLVNGGEVPLSATRDSTQRSFFYPIDFSAYGATELIIFFIATDANNQTSTVDFPIKRDVNAPTIELTTPGLSLAPTITTVRETPFVISGTITDEDLAGFSINDQPVTLLPVSYNQFSFAVGVDVAAGATQSYRLLAWDRARNQTLREVTLQSAGAARIDVIAPTDGKVFETQQATLAVDVVARAYGLPADGSVEVIVDQQAPQTIAASGALVSTSVNVDASSNGHTLVLRARDPAQTVLTTRTVLFETNNSASAPLALTEIKPANGAQYVEPNEFLSLTFNREVDLAKLNIEVRETVHGQTWDLSAQQGVDPVTAGDQAKLVDVHRDQDPVTGSVSLLPGNKTIVYRYDRELAYGAQVYVTVGYDNQELLRTQYTVRALPTQLQGIVADQFAQPVAGVSVWLPDQDRHAITDSNGLYTFGATDSGDQTLNTGRQRIVFNFGLQNRQYGTLENWVSIQSGRVNRTGTTSLPLLDREIPFQHIVGGSNNTLSGGELALDLSNAHLMFPDGTDQGDVHVQFMPREQISYRSLKHANPNWLYQLQPAGIKVTGKAALSMAIPALRGRVDYVPSGDQRLVVVGFDAATKLLLPVGVAKVDQGRIVSTTALNITRLDYLSIALVETNLQSVLQRFERGEITLDELRAGLELGQ